MSFYRYCIFFQMYQTLQLNNENVKTNKNEVWINFWTILELTSSNAERR